MITCELEEDQLSIISRFKTGLRGKIKVELELREVATLEEACKIALRLDNFFKKNPRYTNLNQNQTFNRGQVYSSPNLPLNRNQTISTSNSLPKTTQFTNPSPRTNNSIRCFNFQQIEHVKTNCLKLALVLDTYGPLPTHNFEESEV